MHNLEENVTPSITKEIIKKRFEIAFESSKGLHSRYMGAVAGWLSAPVVIIGWLVTSKESREFLKVNFQVLSYIAVVISFVLFIGLSRNYWVSSRDHQKLLSEIDEEYHIGKNCYSLYEIGFKWRLLGSILLVFSTHMLLLYILVRIFTDIRIIP